MMAAPPVMAGEVGERVPERFVDVDVLLVDDRDGLSLVGTLFA